VHDKKAVGIAKPKTTTKMMPDNIDIASSGSSGLHGDIGTDGNGSATDKRKINAEARVKLRALLKVSTLTYKMHTIVHLSVC
jgi:hypothetical protein